MLPTETRSTTGIFSRPPDIDCHLASWLKISSPARPMKSQYISSTSDAPAFQGIADGRADDRGLGDGRVEQAVVGQGFRQPAIDRKRAAPVAVLFAIGDQRRVDVEAVEDGLEQRVADGDALALGQLLAVGVERRAAAAGKLLDARVLFLAASALPASRVVSNSRPAGWRTSSAPAGCRPGIRSARGEISRSIAFLKALRIGLSIVCFEAVRARPCVQTFGVDQLIGEGDQRILTCCQASTRPSRGSCEASDGEWPVKR